MGTIPYAASRPIISELYLTVLPVIHLGTGLTEQILTLTADKANASEFFPDEVELYINFFNQRIPHLIGGHVTGYTLTRENTVRGLFRVRVTQHAG